MTSRLSRLCDGLLEAGWLAAVIVTPLFFNIHSDRVFEPDKISLLRSIALLMAVVWLVRWIDQRGWRRVRALKWGGKEAFWRKPLVLPVLSLVVVYLLATLFSITPRVSLLGSYQRLQGAYSTLAYVVIFSVMAASIRSRAQIRRVGTAVIIASIPIAFYGLLQHFGLDPLPWGGDVQKRVAGHMGNAIFIAAYLIMAVTLTLSRILDAFTNILSDVNISISDVMRSSIYIFVLVIQLITIYWSGSRGPLIALAVALFAFMLILLVSLRNVSSEKGAFSGRDALLALLLVLPSLLALLFSPTISQNSSPLTAFAVFSGVVLVSVLAVFIFVAARQGWRWLWLSWILLTMLVAGWLLLFNVPADTLLAYRRAPLIGAVLETQTQWKELPTVGSYGRMLDPSQTSGREKSNRVRVLIWHGVIDLISPHAALAFPDGRSDLFNFIRPLIGYGPESMYVAYNRYYPPELATVEARNASPDRSHNETFDALVITGWLGFLAWQALYVSVFYVGFRFLGVVDSKRDRNLLIVAWVGGAVLGAILSLTLVDPIYLGAAVPTGTLVGLIIYLIYYALTAQKSGADVNARRAVPFQTDRLLMLALVAAVLAHYVEIHFGIAIAATRLYFFVYVALMYVISYKLPQEEAVEASSGKARRAGSRAAASSGGKGIWGPIWLWTALLALIVGTLGFEFISYSLPPDKVFQTGADLSAGEIFYQSLFINSQNNFLDSPFIYLMLILTWLLGCMIVASEMVKAGALRLPSQTDTAVSTTRFYTALGALLLLALTGLALRFLLPPLINPTLLLGRSLAFLWGLITLGTAVYLLLDKEKGRLTALFVAAAGLILTLPILVAGGWWFAMLNAVLCGTVLFVFWQRPLRAVLAPLSFMAVGSLVVGLFFTYIQSVLLRESLLYLVFYQGIEPISTLYTLFFRPSTPLPIEELRVLEAMQATRYVSAFYWYLFSLLLIGGVGLAWRRMRREKARGTAVAWVSALLLAVLAIVMINQTNLRVVQADVVYKRGKPFDDQALRTRDPASWDAAIAIYNQALDMAPLEDFYYLFLGRAYLERAALAAEPAEQERLLNTAEARLQDAQRINPLNTDHTANLARLNTRAILSAQDDASRTQRLSQAEAYYQDALQLSPQNSIVRNEYARLLYELRQDCDLAIDAFRDSLAIDPFYTTTYFALTDVLVDCAAAIDDAELQRSYYETAVDVLQAGLEREPQNARAWLQLGQINQQLGQVVAALEAYETARAQDEAGSLPLWNIDLLEAALYKELGDLEEARKLAERALATAPAEAAPQIEAFLIQLEAGE